MKGIKTSTTLQIGDIIRVKTGGTVFSYAGETGETDADTAYAGDVLGEVTKISGSSIVFKDLGGRTRNSVSVGSIDFTANPDFDYAAVVDKQDNTTTLQKWLNFGLGIYDKIFNKTSATTGATGDTGGDGTDDKGTNGGTDNDPPKEEKTFFQQYGIFIIIAATITALVLILKGGKKDERPVQYQQAPTQYLPQNQPQNQYQSVRL